MAQCAGHLEAPSQGRSSSFWPGSCQRSSSFTAFSGKQPHYVLPFLPGFAILAAFALKGTVAKKGDGIGLLVLFAILFLVLAFGPMIAAWTAAIRRPVSLKRGSDASVRSQRSWPAFSPSTAIYFARTIREQALALALASGLLITTVAVQAHLHVFKFYDLAPFAEALKPFASSGPVASASDYAGEVGYLGRLERPIQEIDRKDMKAWFDKNPNGTVIVRHKASDTIPGFTIVYSMPYRPGGRFSIVASGYPVNRCIGVSAGLGSSAVPNFLCFSPNECLRLLPDSERSKN